MAVITRFAPSPTGYLHIGSARTALFNYLYAKHNHGKFLLRIEDTDKVRSTKSAIDAIISGLAWLDLKYDEEIVFQSHRKNRHVEVANELVKKGKAYYCFDTAKELQDQRDKAHELGQHIVFRSKWRDMSVNEYSSISKPVIRLKVPNENKTIINDLVQGKVEIDNDQIDDLVLLRSDGSATYMLACVIDDNDMRVTHVIRGNDHLSNTAKQILLYQAMNWPIPEFSHIPLIHGIDGAKLSKRHGALGVEAYKEMGYLPEALNNYLLRLGWSHGNDEIISRSQAIEWFDINQINKAAAKLDFAKMASVNAHYIKGSTNTRLISLITPILSKQGALSNNDLEILSKAMDSLKLRAKTINELAEASSFLVASHVVIRDAALDIIKTSDITLLAETIELVTNIQVWEKRDIEEIIKQFAANKDIKLNQIMQILRALITGTTASISVFEIMSLLPKSEIITRITRKF